MPTWKKVIVSGSTAQLAAVTVSSNVILGTNQYISTASAATYLSGSFSGSFFGSGAGLTGITATSATNATNTAITDTTTGTGPYYITFVSSNSGNQPQLVDSTGLTYNATTNVITGTSSFAQAVPFTGILNTPTGIVSSSTLAAGSGQGTVTLTTNGVSSGDVTATSLGTSGTPTFAGLTISTNALAVNNTNGITTNAATFPIAPSATTINIGTTTNTAINIGTNSSTVYIPGNLTVNGSTTILNTTNLTVKDPFIFLASGSTSNNQDGGIIVQGATQDTGNALFWDGDIGRWAITPGITTGATSATANSWMVSVSGSTVDPSVSVAPYYGGSTNGIGNMFINTQTGDIFIWT